jgi:hypothetical protein
VRTNLRHPILELGKVRYEHNFSKRAFCTWRFERGRSATPDGQDICCFGTCSLSPYASSAADRDVDIHSFVSFRGTIGGAMYTRAKNFIEEVLDA